MQAYFASIQLRLTFIEFCNKIQLIVPHHRAHIWSQQLHMSQEPSYLLWMLERRMLDKEGFSSLSSCLTLLNPVILTSIFPVLQYLLLSRHYFLKMRQKKKVLEHFRRRGTTCGSNSQPVLYQPSEHSLENGKALNSHARKQKQNISIK